MLGTLRMNTYYIYMCVFVSKYCTPTPEKDLDVFEMFSGCGELSKQCRASLS